MLGHSSLEMSSLREEESVEDLGDGVEVCHHHHAEDDGEGDQEEDEADDAEHGEDGDE